MSGQRWDAKMVTEFQGRDGNTRSFWTKVGAAFTNRDGSITIQLDAFPKDGKIILQVPLSKEERAAKFDTHGQAMRREQGQPQQSFGSQASRYRKAPPAPPSYPAQQQPQGDYPQDWDDEEPPFKE